MTRRAAEATDLPGFFSGIDTLPALLSRRAQSTPLQPAYFEQRAGAWHPVTWATFHQEVIVVAAQLRRLGVRPGGRIGILAGTSVNWEIVQMAALACGAVVVGIDPYYPDTIVAELIAELGLVGLLVEDPTALACLDEETRSALRFIVLLRDEPAADHPQMPTLRQLRSAADASSELHSVAAPNAAAFIAFSSGSTGRPKPILYTHAQVVHACRSILELYPELSPGTRLVCWLPLANLFQRMINLAAIAKGATSYVVSDPREVMTVLPIARPEVFVAVPRFCERVHAGIVDKLATRPALARIVEFAIALRIDMQRGEEHRVRYRPLKRFALRIADRAILSRLRAVFGGELRFIVTGSAPMPDWLLRRYSAIGIPVLEAYGASENLVPITANRYTDRRIGTVGKPAGDNLVRISEDGQVEVRGAGTFIPTLGENAARAASLTEDGYLATGDLGAFDEDGFLVLRGRRSEAFKNAQGRWISLPLIEAALRRIPGVEHAAAIRLPGDRLVGVLALRARTDKGGAVEDAKTVEVRDGVSLRKDTEAVLRDLPSAERPFAFIVACAGFSAAGLELTTNLKLRRAAIAQRVAAPLESLVAEYDARERSGAEGLLIKFV